MACINNKGLDVMLATIWFVAKILLGIMITFAIFHALVTHFLLWFELRLKSLQGELTEKIPILTIAKSFCIEACCTFIRFFLYPFLLFSEDSSKGKGSQATPILLVHGYLQNQTDWLWFKRKLQENPEIGPIFSLNLFPPFNSITQFSEILKEEIEKIKAETKQDKIILIGHSMGGLVCSYYSEFLAKPGEILKVITIGSPFQGTRLAALGFGENVKEMSPRSSFLHHLTSRIQQSKIPYHHIASQLDNMIVPWQSAFPGHSHSHHNNLVDANKLILTDHGHLRMLVSPKVVHQVAKWVLKAS